MLDRSGFGIRMMPRDDSVCSAGGPPCARDVHLDAQHLALPLHIPTQSAHSRPSGGDHVQRRTVRPAKHAGEAAAVERDRREHLAALGHPYAVLVWHVGIPGGALGI